MTTLHTMFPIKFMFNGMGFETKALKYTYNREVLYKIALPSAVSSVQQCWITKNAEEWKLVMGTATEKGLMPELIAAIKKQEQILAVIPTVVTVPKQALKSA